MNTIEFFDKKKVLIVVPHQDDEINIAGGLIYTIKDISDIYVVYTTNGDYIWNAEIRYKEVINSLKKLGVNKNKIIFCGYPDSSYDCKTHMYTSENGYTSKINKDRTYGVLNIDEYCYKKNNKHKQYKKENLIDDLKNILLELSPDIIIGVDLDFHPDHIMTSLCLEKAIGMIIRKKNNKYYPIVLKTFAYENSYLGPNDFNKNGYNLMYFENNNNRLINNPYYSLKNKLDFNVSKECISKNLFINPIWKAIICHKSQLLVKNAFRIINDNYSYWMRNTNNLINKAKISVSSGDESLLHDFMLCDCTDILNGNEKKIIYDEGIWIPKKEDLDKEIIIEFDKEEYIKTILLYSGIKNKKRIKKIKLIIDGKDIVLDTDNIITKYEISKKIKKIKIKVLDKIVENGFSEIELLNEKNIYNNIEITNKKHSFIIFVFNNLILNVTLFLTKVYRKIFLRKKVNYEVK